MRSLQKTWGTPTLASLFSQGFFCIPIPHQIQMQNFCLVWKFSVYYIWDSTWLLKLILPWSGFQLWKPVKHATNKQMSDDWIKLWMKNEQLAEFCFETDTDPFIARFHLQFPQPCPWEASQSFSTSKVICIFVFSNFQIVVFILYFCVVVFCSLHEHGYNPFPLQRPTSPLQCPCSVGQDPRNQHIQVCKNNLNKHCDTVYLLQHCKQSLLQSLWHCTVLILQTAQIQQTWDVGLGIEFQPLRPRGKVCIFDKVINFISHSTEHYTMFWQYLNSFLSYFVQKTKLNKPLIFIDLFTQNFTHGI